MNELQLLHHLSQRHDIPLELKETRNCTLPSGCSISDFSYTTPHTISDSYLTTLNSRYLRLCTSDCAGAIGEYYRCLDSGDTGEYWANYYEKFYCGKQSGDYCPAKLIRSLKKEQNEDAYDNIRYYCSIPTTGSASCKRSECTDALKTFSSAIGCCMEPLYGSGVRSCGVSIPDACAGVSSATGIIATPIVAVSLMILALAGVFL